MLRKINYQPIIKWPTFSTKKWKKRFCNYPPNLHFACSGRRGHRAWAKIDGEKCSPETKAQKLIFYIDFPSAMQRKIGENILYIVYCLLYHGVRSRTSKLRVLLKKIKSFLPGSVYYYCVLLSAAYRVKLDPVGKSCLTNIWPCPLSFAQFISVN